MLCEKSYAIELNRLPENRTELTNIKKVSIHINEFNLVELNMYVDYIFPISLEEHYFHTKMHLTQGGLTFKPRTRLLNDYNPNKNVTWYYLNPFFGNVTAKLYRAKTLVYETNLTNLTPSNNTLTGFHCTGNDAKSRECDLTRFCFNSNTMFYTYLHDVKFPSPFMTLSDYAHFITRSTSNSMQNTSVILPYNLEGNVTYPGSHLIVSFNNFDPFSWETIYNVASPLATLVNNSETSENIFAIGAPNYVVNSSFAKIFGNIIPVIGQNISCVDKGSIKRLNPSWEARTLLKSMIIEKINQKTYEKHDCIILQGTNPHINFTNMNEIARSISKTDPHILNISETSEVEVIYAIYHAKYIFATSGSATGLAFWVNKGKYFEFVPSGFEGLQSGYLAANSQNVSYYRYSVSKSDVLLLEEPGNYPSTTIIELNGTYTIPMFEFKEN